MDLSREQGHLKREAFLKVGYLFLQEVVTRTVAILRVIDTLGNEAAELVEGGETLVFDAPNLG